MIVGVINDISVIINITNKLTIIVIILIIRTITKNKYFTNISK
jgi:hypothetical protein